MNKEIETISEEQFLHNKLSFEINQELIHLMKRIVQLQQENEKLKETLNLMGLNPNVILFLEQENKELHNKIDKAIEVIHTQMKNNPSYKENLKIIENNLIKGSCKVCDLKDSDVDE